MKVIELNLLVTDLNKLKGGLKEVPTSVGNPRAGPDALQQTNILFKALERPK